jgi:hypothetical protein
MSTTNNLDLSFYRDNGYILELVLILKTKTYYIYAKRNGYKFDNLIKIESNNTK